MLKMLLGHALHGEQIAVTQLDGMQGRTTPISFHLKCPRGSQGHGDDADIAGDTLEKGFVVCVPADAGVPILVHVEVATVRP